MKTGPDVVAKPAIGALSRLRFGLRADRFWLRLRRSSLLVENGDASIFPASSRDHIAAVRTISTNESPVSPQATQARIGGFARSAHSSHARFISSFCAMSVIKNTMGPQSRVKQYAHLTSPTTLAS